MKKLPEIFLCLSLLFFAVFAFAANVPEVDQIQCLDNSGNPVICSSSNQRFRGRDVGATINSNLDFALDSSGNALPVPPMPSGDTMQYNVSGQPMLKRMINGGPISDLTTKVEQERAILEAVQRDLENPPNDTSSNEEANVATISGTVFQSNGTTPLTGKTIFIYAYTGSPCGDHSQAGYAMVNSTTGKYTIPGLPAGTYYLQTYAFDTYIDEWWASPLSVRNCATAQSIVVTDGQAVSNKNFQLDPGATISGTVYQSDGKTPLTGKTIMIYAYTGAQCGDRTQVGYAMVTSTTGKYTISRLPSGSYYLQTISSENYLSEWWASPLSVRNSTSAQAVAVTNGQAVIGKNFQLDPGATISGTVFQSNGSTPLTGKTIMIYAYTGAQCSNRALVGVAIVNPTTGKYTIPRLLAGSYYLQTHSSDNYVSEWWASPLSVRNSISAQAIAVANGQAVINKNFQLDPGATISGTVYQSNGTTPLTGKSIYVAAYTGLPCSMLTEIGYASVNSTTGKYTIPGLTAGTYYLQTFSPENYLDEWWASPLSVRNCATAQAIAVADKQVVINKNFQLDPGATISGTVYQSNGITPLTGKNIGIIAYTGSPCGTHTVVGYASVNSTTGKYTIPGLTAGTYYLQADPSENYVSEWWASPLSVRNCAGAQAIAVADKQVVTGKNFQLDTGATISGTVYQANGTTPLTCKSIWIYAYTGSPCGAHTEVGYALVNPANGKYTIIGLPAGSYYLQTSSSENYVSEWWASPSSVRACAGAQAIAVADKQVVAGKNFQLDTGATISGTVYQANGTTPLTCKSIWIHAYTGSPCGTHTEVGYALVNEANGKYTIPGLPAGTYYLQTSSSQNYFSEWWASPLSVRDCAGAQAIAVAEKQAVISKNFQLEPSAGAATPETLPVSGISPSTKIMTTSSCNCSPDASIPFTSAMRQLSGVWPDGVRTWNQATNQWTQTPSSSDAVMLASGKMDGDNEEDLVGVWSSGLYLRQSTTGQWVRLSQALPGWITTGDLNNDGLDDVIGSWPDDGVCYRDSSSGKWVKISPPARQLSVGNIGGYHRDDLFGIWDSGLWVRYSATSGWQQIDSAIPIWITAGDMTGSGRSDIIGSYPGGTWYWNSATAAWTMIAASAEQLIAGDIDGDGRDDLIGIWADGVWVQYGATGQWQHMTSSKPLRIFTSSISDAVQSAGSLDDPWESSDNQNIVDLSKEGPGSADITSLMEKGPETEE